MHVSQLWRYPVKSMMGSQVDSVRLDALGIVDDRTWATRDLERGGIRGAKKIGGLMQLAARDLDGGHVEITLSDGSVVTTHDADVDARVSAAIGQQVRLERLRPPDDLEHYRRGGPDSDDFMEEVRGMFGRDVDEPLPDFSIFPPELTEFESPPGTYYDAFPLLVITESALRTIAAALPESNLDIRRFRPSIVVETGRDDVGHPESEWSRSSATVGSGGAVVDFGPPCPRCVMVTREVDRDVPTDRAVLRHIVRDLDQNLGVYASIRTPGPISVGDLVTFR
jgi:uncharacterized protein